jgi:hypothetical protein
MKTSGRISADEVTDAPGADRSQRVQSGGELCGSGHDN